MTKFAIISLTALGLVSAALSSALAAEAKNKPTPPASAPTQATAPAPPTDNDPDQIKQHQAEYKRCLRLAGSKPDDGYEEALAWGSMGGGEAAKHCAALARIAQKQYADGAKRLETLARESRQEKAMRANMLAQAAQAWILEGNYDQASADQLAALTLLPDDPDLLVDHAITLGQVHHYKEAVDDLNKVLGKNPNRLDALLLRASAYRYLENRPAALFDVDRVLIFDPGNPEALVERGILKRLAGDDKGARADWLKVIETLSSGPILQEAQRNLELLDVKGTIAPTNPSPAAPK